MAPPVALLTNPNVLTVLLRLGFIWHAHLAVRMSVRRAPPETSPPAGYPANTEVVHVTVAAVKRADYLAFPAAPDPYNDPSSDDYYGVGDADAPLVHNVWVAYAHMISERGQERIWGPAAAASGLPLIDRCAEAAATYAAGGAVDVYLDDLASGDEFGCDGGDVHGLAAGLGLVGRGWRP